MDKKAYSRYEYFGVLATAVLSAILHTVLYLQCYDFPKSLWQSGTSGFLKLSLYLPLIPALFLGVMLSKKAKEKGELCHTNETVYTKIAAFFVTASFVLTVVCQFLSIGSGNKLAGLLDPASKSYMSLTAALHILTLLTAFFAAGYFFFRARGKVELVLGMAAIVYLMFYALRLYFDMTMHINNPRWEFGVFALASILLYTVFEVDQLLFKAKPYCYVLSATLALVTGLSYSLSEIVLALFNRSGDGLFAVYAVLVLGLTFWIATRLYALLFVETAEKAPEVPEVTEPSEESECEEEVALDTPTDELSREELVRFYNAIYKIVAKKRGVDEASPEADREKLRGEVLGMLSHLLEGDSRKENIEHMRAFLMRLEENT